MIILDYNAITPIFPEILDEVNHLLKNNFFLNPSSVHTEGKNAKKILEKAKTEILQNFNAKCHEIYFTSGGTESNNMALNFKVFDCIFTLETEHDSILNPVSKLKHKFIKLDENGLVDLRDLATQIKALNSSNFLCSFLLANNETGVVQNINDIAKIVHENGGILHSDVSQFIGKEKFDFTNFHLDVITFSGNKIHAGFGGGVIIFTSGMEIKPLILGGGQQNYKRGGTENLPQIYALSKAILKVNSEEYLTNYFQKTHAFQQKIETEISKIGGEIFGKNVKRISNTSSIFMPNVNNFIQAMEFDLNGICISIGSACSSGRTTVSHVLKACGVAEEKAKNYIRISASPLNNLKEIEKFLSIWKKLFYKGNFR